MAATFLKRTAAIRLPPRSVGERAFASEALLLLTPAGADVAAPPMAVSLEALPEVRSAVLVLDARDVTLLRVKLPPLSGARLARALPNLLEDSLLQDVHQCGFALGPRVGEGERLVGVVDRSWLEFVVGAFERRGVRVQAVWPAQLAMVTEPGEWSVTGAHDGLAIQTGPEEGFGWSASGDVDFRTEAIVNALEAASRTAEKPGAIVVRALSEDWGPSLQRAAERFGVPVRSGSLTQWAEGPLDLLVARQGSAQRRWLASIEWREWRPAGVVLLLCAVVSILGLNLDWMRLGRERAALRAAMESEFRQAFPGAQVVIDPLLQMRRQVADLRLRGGQSGPDDFLPLLARWSALLGPQGTDALASLEYREGALRLRFKPGLLDPALRERLRAACAQQGLQLQADPAEPDLVRVGRGS